MLSGCIVAALLTAVAGQVSAASHKSNRVNDYLDSLQRVKTEIYNDTSAAARQKLAALKNDNSDYFMLFSPPTFYHGVSREALGYDDDMYSLDTESEVNRTLLNTYLNRPELIDGTETLLSTMGETPSEVNTSLTDKVVLAEAEAPAPEDIDIAPVEITVEKPKFWTYTGEYSLQLMQNYVSDNWYKGGESSYSALAKATMQANYNNLDKVKWDNKLELKLGLCSYESDSLHKFKTSEDLIRLTSKFGLQATKNWYYTLQMVAYTQFYRGYKANNKTVYSDFFSPFNLNISLGMDYTVKALNDKLTGSINISPFAYNFRYVGRLSLSTRYSVDEGHHTKHEFGSNFTVNLTWKFTDNISWKTRLYGYTSYKRAELEWENTFLFQLNKYLATTIFLYPRFDDGGTRDEDHGYWQMHEYISFGLNYSF